MRRFLTPFRLALAILAAAFSGAAPALAYAPLQLAGHPGYAEICTDTGVKRVPLGVPEGGDEQSSGKVSHCVLCVVSGGAQALGGTTQPLLVPSGAERPVRVAAQASTPVEPVRAAPPRGPPALDPFA